MSEAPNKSSKNQTQHALVEGERFVTAWLNIDKFPGGMMVSSSSGRFGPVPAMTGCSITTSATMVEEWREKGMPVIEVQLRSAHETPDDAHLKVLAGALIRAANEPGHKWGCSAGRGPESDCTCGWWEIRQLAKELSQKATVPQEKRETGWLVENGRSGSELRYRSMDQGMSTWTADHQEAIRFARRKDAELFAAEDEDAWCIVEHQWITLDGDSVHCSGENGSELQATSNRRECYMCGSRRHWTMDCPRNDSGQSESANAK